MKTISREEFEKTYGAQALNQLGTTKPKQRSTAADVGIGFAKGVGDTVTETANMFVEGGRLIQAGLNPNKTYGEMSQEANARSDSRPAWVNPFSGQAEDVEQESLESDNKTQMFGKGVAFGAEALIPTRGAITALTKGDEAVNMVRKSMQKADIDTPKFSRERVVNTLTKYRTQLSDIDPQYETVLQQQQNPDKMLAYFDAAEKSAVDPAAPMATTIASKRGVEAFESITTGMQEAGRMKGELLDSIADVKIGGNIPGRSIDNVKSIIETRYGMVVDAQGNFTQAPGRIAKLDKPSQDLLREYITELRSLGQSPSAKRLDDMVDKLQGMLYKQSSPNLFQVADDPVIGFLKQQTGEINSQLKSNVDSVLKLQGKDPAYSALNDQYSRLIRAQQDLNKALGDEGDKGAGLMKSLFSPQTGERTRQLFQTIQDETGINLFEEATLAKFAMESVGDPRSQSLLKQLDILAAKSTELDITKPGSWLRAAREAVDLDGKELGEQIIKQSNEAEGTAAKALSPETEVAVQKLGERLNGSSANNTPEYLKNNKQGGFANFFGSIIPERITPNTVAGKMDDADFNAIAEIADDVANARLNPAVNRLLDDMGIGKASDDDVKAFLVRTSDEYAKTSGKAKGATAKTTDLVEEAKKYDSAGDFFESLSPVKRDEVRKLYADTDMSQKEMFDDFFEKNTGKVKQGVTELGIKGLGESDAKLLTETAKGYATYDEFYGAMRGSATQYGEYNPKLRKFVLPETVRVSEIEGVDPNATITVYRGIDDVEGKVSRKINKGDFVTTDFDDALGYTGSPSDVVEMEVKVKDLLSEYPDEFDVENMTSYELIYTPNSSDFIKISDEQLKQVWDNR